MGDYYDNSFGYIRLGSRTYGKTEQMIKEAYERGKKEERERIKGIINEAIKPGPGRKLTFFFEDMIIKTCREILEKIG